MSEGEKERYNNRARPAIDKYIKEMDAWKMNQKAERDRIRQEKREEKAAYANIYGSKRASNKRKKTGKKVTMAKGTTRKPKKTTR